MLCKSHIDKIQLSVHLMIFKHCRVKAASDWKFDTSMFLFKSSGLIQVSQSSTFLRNWCVSAWNSRKKYAWYWQYVYPRKVTVTHKTSLLHRSTGHRFTAVSCFALSSRQTLWVRSPFDLNQKTSEGAHSRSYCPTALLSHAVTRCHNVKANQISWSSHDIPESSDPSWYRSGLRSVLH